jgi:hypothetical protein
MQRILALAILTTAAVLCAEARANASTLIIHEWGTFTSFQDDRGATIAGINVDDEPVPKFVHRLDELPIFTTRSRPATWSQGSPRCHADVTLRLETPVLYFYPQDGFDRDQSLEVRATFAGGWLTEFFPWAAAENPGFPGTIEPTSQGSLRWTGLHLPLNTDIKMPETAERVWLAPRDVRSAVVANGEKNEAEKYLFYRGVGRIDAPIVVREQAGALTIALRDGGSLHRLPPMWIVQVLADGRLAYRRVHASEQHTATATLPLARETAPSALDGLQEELKTVLIAEGLYEDEAQAMLATWRLSYFESEGMRVFFLLPRSWIEAHLPLSTSVPAEITRVMLGRVELVSAHQRAVLKQLYELPENAFPTKPLYYESNAVLRLVAFGEASHAELYRRIGRDVPEALRLYDSLGRFRDALLAHELRSTSDEVQRARLKKIIANFSSCVPENLWSQ